MTKPGSPIRGRLRPADFFVPMGAISLLVLMLGAILANAGDNARLRLHLLPGRRPASARRQADLRQRVLHLGRHVPGKRTHTRPSSRLRPDPVAHLWGAAAGAWCIAMAVCSWRGVALLAGTARTSDGWWSSLAALDWPFINAVKLGPGGAAPLPWFCRGPGAGWIGRLLSGSLTAVGGLVKIQPAILGGWALFTRRYRAVAVAAVVALAAASAATLVTGFGVWATYVDLVRGLKRQLLDAHNSAPGAVAHLAGHPIGWRRRSSWRRGPSQSRRCWPPGDGPRRKPA